MKKLIAQFTLLTAILCMSLSAHAYDCIVDGICYNLNSSRKTATITCYSRDTYRNAKYYTDAIVIPETISYKGKEYTVTSIDGNAFAGCSDLTAVAFPNSALTIGEFAFYNCSALTSVEMSNSVTTICENAFCGCSDLTSVEISNSVVIVCENAFRGCSDLTSVEISNSVVTVCENAFRGCSDLTSVEISNSVVTVNKYAFYQCTGLTSVEITNSQTTIDKNAFRGCPGLTSVTPNIKKRRPKKLIIKETEQKLGRLFLQACKYNF